MARFMLALLIAFNVVIGGATVCGALGQEQANKAKDEVAFGVAPALPMFKGEGSGELRAHGKDGDVVFPLKHTDVNASIAGHIARVTVKQEFENPLSDIMEAVYTFPLSDSAAVDEMVMKVGDRTIHGTIKKKEDARAIYEKAKQEGHTAALLDQERPNIFTQSVANIPPHKSVEVTISYVDMLPYEDGKYTFAFPTVVGPRFSPGAKAVPDAAKISPPLVKEGERSGHDISISVDLDSPVSVSQVESKSHEISASKISDHRYKVVLQNKAAIPNKDYVLTWNVADKALKSGYLVTAKDGQGYFNISFIPPKRPTPDQIQPKEMVFLIDASGSQHGAPIAKAKEVMQYSIDHMNPNDTFQVISFNNVVTYLFDKPRTASVANRQAAKKYLEQLEANGGTWMAPAVEAACAIPADQHRLRIVSFMTDGYVGNDFQIIGLIQKLRKTSRWFPFGTGNSVNRFLIDNIAKAGGGEPDYVYLNSSAEEAGKKFYDKIANPVLTDVAVDFDGLKVKDVYPKGVGDVWAQRPLYITGRFLEPGKGTVKISGYSGGKPYSESLNVVLPQEQSQNASLGSLWARAFVDYMTAQDWVAHQPGAPTTASQNELKDEITRVALEHHIMTQYTSFVAVEETTKVEGGKKVTVEVPVEVPEGVERKFVETKEKSKSLANAGMYGGKRIAYMGGQYSALPQAPMTSNAIGVAGSGGAVTLNASGRASDRGVQINAATGFNVGSLKNLVGNYNQALAPANQANLPHVHRARTLYSGAPAGAGVGGDITIAAKNEPAVSDEEIAKLAKQKLSAELLEWFNKEGTDKIRVQIHFDEAGNIPPGWDPKARIIFDPPSLVMDIDRHALRYYLTIAHVKSITIVKEEQSEAKESDK